jgi:hypothetical protein
VNQPTRFFRGGSSADRGSCVRLSVRRSGWRRTDRGWGRRLSHGLAGRQPRPGHGNQAGVLRGRNRPVAAFESGRGIGDRRRNCGHGGLTRRGRLRRRLLKGRAAGAQEQDCRRKAQPHLCGLRQRREQPSWLMSFGVNSSLRLSQHTTMKDDSDIRRGLQPRRACRPSRAQPRRSDPRQQGFRYPACAGAGSM